MPYSLLTIGVFIIFALLITIACLSYFTQWPKRESVFFLQHRYHFTQKISERNRNIFPCLLRQKEDNSFQTEYTDPALYLSVVIPAMNEEKRLPLMLDECLDYLEERSEGEKGFTYEVIVVDDGSSDRTSDVAYEYCSKCSSLFVLRLPDNIGKGGAVRAGILCSRGRFILFADADGATKFSEFKKLEAEAKRQCNAETFGSPLSTDWTHPVIVVGSRSHLEKESIASRSLFRTFLMFGFHALVFTFTVRSVRDTQCGFKLMSRAAAAKLIPKFHIERWAFDVELLYIAERLYFSISEVPINWTEIDGSKITPFFSWLQMGRDVSLIWFRYTFGIWKLEE